MRGQRLGEKNEPDPGMGPRRKINFKVLPKQLARAVGSSSVAA